MSPLTELFLSPRVLYIIFQDRPSGGLFTSEYIRSATINKHVYTLVIHALACDSIYLLAIPHASNLIPNVRGRASFLYKTGDSTEDSSRSQENRLDVILVKHSATRYAHDSFINIMQKTLANVSLYVYVRQGGFRAVSNCIN